jgi:hypothetical protein
LLSSNSSLVKRRKETVYRLFRRLLFGLYCPLSLLKMKRLWYALRLSTRGVAECLSLASSFGVTDLTLPALDNEPCEGIFNHPVSLDDNTGDGYL